MIIELIRELILLAGAFLFISGSLKLATGKGEIGGILLGYGTLPFAVDSIVHRQYIYFLVWVAICYFAFSYVYQHSHVEQQKFESDLDNILSEE